MRTEHTSIDLTTALLDFPLSGAQLHPSVGSRLLTPHAAAARGHTQSQPRSRDFSSCPSICHECGDRFSRFHHFSRRVAHSLEPVPIHNPFVTRTHCPCQSTYEAKASTVLVRSKMQQIDWPQRQLQVWSRGLASPRFPEPSCPDSSGSPSHSQLWSAPVISCQ